MYGNKTNMDVNNDFGMDWWNMNICRNCGVDTESAKGLQQHLSDRICEELIDRRLLACRSSIAVASSSMHADNGNEMMVDQIEDLMSDMSINARPSPIKKNRDKSMDNKNRKTSIPKFRCSKVCTAGVRHRGITKKLKCTKSSIKKCTLMTEKRAMVPTESYEEFVNSLTRLNSFKAEMASIVVSSGFGSSDTASCDSSDSFNFCPTDFSNFGSTGLLNMSFSEEDGGCNDEDEDISDVDVLHPDFFLL